MVSWLLCCELARIPPPTQASTARWEGAARQGGIWLSGDLFKGNRNSRLWGLFCPSLLQQQGGWSSCMKSLTTVVATHPAVTGIPMASQKAPLLPHSLALSSQQEETSRKRSLEKPSRRGCHLSCLWELCRNRFSSSALSFESCEGC